MGPAKLPLVQRAALLILLSVCCAAYWWGVFDVAPASPETTAFALDLHAYFYPRFVYGSGELAAGHVPLWNPYELFGVPFLATAQAAVLYPPKNLLFWLLPAEQAMRFFMVLHYLLGLVLFIAFARETIGASLPAAGIGALLWIFNPLVLHSNWHPNRIANLVWFPLLLLLAERMRRQRARAAVVAFGWVLALQLCAGYPEYSVVGLILLGLRVFLARFERGEVSWSRLVGRASAAVGLGVLLGAPQLAPLAEAVGNSARLGGADLLVASFYGTVLASLPRLLTPLHISLPLLGLILSGGPRRRFNTLAVLLAGGFMLASTLLADVGPFALARAHGWIWAQIGFLPLAALATLGVDEFVRLPRVGASLLAVGPGLLVAGLSGWREHAAGAIALALSVGALSMPARRPFLRQGALLAACGAVFAGVIASAPARTTDYVPTVAERRRAFASVARLLSATGPARPRFLATAHTRFGDQLLARWPTAATHEESLTPRRQRRAFDYLGLYSVMLWGRPIPWEHYVASRPLVDAAGIALLVGPPATRPLLERADGYQVLGEAVDGDLIYRNPTALPRAMVVHQARVVAGEVEAFRAVTAPRFMPRSEVILEPPAEPLAPTPEAVSAATIVADEPERVAIDAETSAPGYLVLADSYAPGWTATVDGVPATIYPADGLFRAVAVGVGRHAVVFRYRPLSFRLGVAAAALGAALSAAAFARASESPRPVPPAR